jgi:SAM-dependent methyltransferase
MIRIRSSQDPDNDSNWAASHQHYWQAIAPIYDKLYRDPWSASEDSEVATMVRRLVSDQSTVVDLGCGTGLGCRLLDPGQTQVGYVGVDISAEMLYQFDCANENATLVEKDALEFLHSCPNAATDSIICLNGSMSLFPNPDAVVREVYRVIRPGGVCLLSFLNRLAIPELSRNLGRRRFLYPTRHAPRALGAAPAKAFSHRELGSLASEVFGDSWRLWGLSTLAGWFEQPVAWNLDRAITSRFPYFAHTLYLEASRQW